jgi:hypothetical protein
MEVMQVPSPCHGYGLAGKEFWFKFGAPGIY